MTDLNSPVTHISRKATDWWQTWDLTLRMRYINVTFNSAPPPPPPFSRQGQQMISSDVLLTKKITKHRVHIERAIERIKILSGRVDMSLFSQINKIWFVRATCMIPQIRHLSYSERLKHLGLPALQYRRLRADTIEVFKILTEVVQCICHIFKHF